MSVHIVTSFRLGLYLKLDHATISSQKGLTLGRMALSLYCVEFESGWGFNTHLFKYKFS